MTKLKSGKKMIITAIRRRGVPHVHEESHHQKNGRKKKCQQLEQNVFIKNQKEHTKMFI